MPRPKRSSPIAIPSSGQRWHASEDYAYSTIERIGEKIQPQPDGCWLYTGGTQAYARVQGNRQGRQMQAHRFVYEVLVGPIPDGHVLHHTCHNTRCVNPDHLQPLTRSDHMSLHAQERRVQP